MASRKRSFGYQLILADRPDLAFDLQQLRDDVAAKGSLDQIAVELEATGSGSAFAIRTNALRTLGVRISRDYENAAKALGWIAARDARLGVWGSCVCAREALRFVPMEDPSLLRAVELTEASLVDAGKAKSASKARRQVDTGGGELLEYYVRRSVGFESYSSAVVYAAFAIASASSATVPSSGDDTRDVEIGIELYDRLKEGELRRLVGVIADALPGFPVRVR